MRSGQRSPQRSLQVQERRAHPPAGQRGARRGRPQLRRRSQRAARLRSAGERRYDTYDQPEFLDDFVKACGAEAVAYDPKTSCCGGSVSVYSPDKTLHLIKKILQAAVDAGADVVATPSPLCQQNVEMYQDAINRKFGTNFDIPVVFYSQLMAVAFGMDAEKDAALDRNMIKPLKLVELAKKSSA